MRKLERGPVPRGLLNYKHGHDNWSSVDADTKAEVWNALESMQGSKCAYCEATISIDSRHIEHFRQRSRYITFTFDWANLFGSCNREESCGKHKDRCGFYPPEVLIKPDIDNPDDFFVFVSDGTIVPRKDLSAPDNNRAKETLRILNLDAQNGALRHMRRRQIAGYLQIAEEIRQFEADLKPDELFELVEDELKKIENQPFFTAIRHALLGNLP